MPYESYTLGLHIPNGGSQQESPMEPRGTLQIPMGANNGQFG